MRKLTKPLSILLLAAACSAPQKEESQEETPVEEPATVEVDIQANEVEYATNSTNMKGYIAFDAGTTEKRPGILVIHEWWGHNDYVRQRADMLAEMGYVALAVDMYGDGKQAAHPDDAMAFTQEATSNLDEAKARFEQALETLKANPNVDPDKIGVIGYCFGGTVALSMASAGYDLDAVAAFHAGLGLPIMPEDSTSIKGKILVANGADDPFIPAQQVEDFKSVMDNVGADYRYVSYPGAVHAFTSQGADSLGQKFNLPLAYNEEADKASWEEMKKLFEASF